MRVKIKLIRTIDYFFNYSDDLPELIKNINACLGCSLARYGDDSEDLFCRFLGMEFSLSKHALENDRELDFENYKYEIGFTVAAPDADLRELQLPAIILIIYALFSRMKITGMLVYDVQNLIAKYEERFNKESNSSELYDTVSAEFIKFPNHFEIIHKKLEK